MNLNKKAFTLIELVITLVVVSILTIVSANIHKRNIQKAKMTEGKTLASAIADAEDVYYAEHDKYYSVSWTSNADDLNINASANKYFRYFKVDASTNKAVISVSTESGGASATGLSIAVTINSEDKTYSSEVDNISNK